MSTTPPPQDNGPIQIALLSDREFEILKLTMEASWGDARARLDSAERIGEAIVRGMLVLNAAGIATIVAVLGLKSDSLGSALRTEVSDFLFAILAFVGGVGVAASAAALFSEATYTQAKHELNVAEGLLYEVLPRLAGPPGGGRDEYRRQLSLSWWVRSLLICSFICFAAGCLLAFFATLPNKTD